jgi:hypothetical protein
VLKAKSIWLSEDATGPGVTEETKKSATTTVNAIGADVVDPVVEETTH